MLDVAEDAPTADEVLAKVAFTVVASTAAAFTVDALAAAVVAEAATLNERLAGAFDLCPNLIARARSQQKIQYTLI